MQTLEVEFVALTECVVSPGYRLAFNPAREAGVHYNLAGQGHVVVDGHAPIRVTPHTLVIIPAGKSFRFEVGGPNGSIKTVSSPRPTKTEPGVLQRFEAGEGEPRMMLICGNFRTRLGDAADLFKGLDAPIVEQFDSEDRLDEHMKDAFRELLAQEEGTGTMAASLLKQVIVKLLRRSVASNELWVERLSVLKDPPIARAFADMIARPGAAHTSDTLAHTAGMSRSVFMDKFTQLFGQPPIAVLRQLRLSHAKDLLVRTSQSVDHVAHELGYTSRSSFNRAFKSIFHQDPTEYRERARAARRTTPLNQIAN